MVFYTAGPWVHREQVKEVAEKLRAAGWTVNSRWLDIPADPPEGTTYEQYQQLQARNDLNDVVKADALVYVNTGYKSEGKATELGVAIAMLKPIIIIGGRENNIFLNLSIPAFPTVEEAIDWMKEQEMEHAAKQVAANLR